MITLRLLFLIFFFGFVLSFCFLKIVNGVPSHTPASSPLLIIFQYYFLEIFRLNCLRRCALSIPLVLLFNWLILFSSFTVKLIYTFHIYFNCHLFELEVFRTFESSNHFLKTVCVSHRFLFCFVICNITSLQYN